jgi:hypothetical protein
MSQHDSAGGCPVVEVVELPVTQQACPEPQVVEQIDGLGVSGFMKLPYKNTKFFSYLEKQPDCFSVYR